jgi:hypothetical protein
MSVMKEERDHFPRSKRYLATPQCIKNKDGGRIKKRRETSNKIMEENME